MPENPAVKTPLSYRVWRETEDGVFTYEQFIRAVSEQAAVAVWIEENPHIELHEGVRLAVRRTSSGSAIHLFKLAVPKRTFSIIPA